MAPTTQLPLSFRKSRLATTIYTPFTFHLRTMVPVELNYEIYNKELLTIQKVFKHWHLYLEGATHVVLVMSDHKNLKYFTTTKVLTH